MVCKGRGEMRHLYVNKKIFDPYKTAKNLPEEKVIVEEDKASQLCRLTMNSYNCAV
jgi:hypothetical protein